MIRVIQRHCNFSSNSAHKERPEWFDREKIFDSFIETFTDEVDYVALFDSASGDINNHFLSKKSVNIINIDAGSETRSFVCALQYAKAKQYDDKDIIYFVEDDYLHRNGWANIMIEGFEHIGADYFTLYDHPDKYYLPMYEQLTSKVIATDNIHWRSTPSTTCTFACRYETLNKYFDTHLEFCKGEYTRDHDMFTELWKKGSNLISCIPGYSTHVESNMMSPLIDWSKV